MRRFPNPGLHELIDVGPVFGVSTPMQVMLPGRPIGRMGSHRRHGTFELEPTEEMTFAGPGFFGTATFDSENGPGASQTFRVSNGRVLNLLFTRTDFE